MAEMRWVAQEHPDGCGVAVLAMLTDDTYENVAAALRADPWMEGNGFALTQPVLEKYLSDRGWYLRRVYVAWQTPGCQWPPEPFAERHYAIVTQPSGNGHFVAVEADGTLLDPLRSGSYRLTDFQSVSCLVGLLRQSDG